MSKVVLTKDRKMFDVTTVDNIFISEFLPNAPDFAVKVYLYGLMLTGFPSYCDVDLAAVFGVDEHCIRDAYEYWQTLGLVSITNGEALNVKYLNISQALVGAKSGIASATQYSSLIEGLRNALGTRMLSGSELQKIYDWIEVFGFDEEAVVAIVSHCIEVKGSRTHINYMDGVAKRLAADRVLSGDAVRRSLESEKRTMGGALSIIRRWNMGRKPTEDEIELYNKWTKAWGFSDDAIALACTAVVASDRPSFKYLDAILSSYQKEGSVSIEKITALRAEHDQIAEIARQAFEKARLKRAPTSADVLQFTLWHKDWCIPVELILLAAEYSMSKPQQFAAMKKLLNEWHDRGIVTLDAAKASIEQAKQAFLTKKQNVNTALSYRQKRYTKEQLAEMGISFGEEIDDEE